MRLKRTLAHLLTPDWRAGTAFPPASLARIEAAVAASERGHTGEIRFAVEPALAPVPLLRGMSARERAIEVFAQLRVWDTERNNGVLIYLLLADRDVEIVADRGIDARVGPGEWEAICRDMEDHFRAGRFEEGVIHGIRAVGAHLAAHFPGEGGVNELPDAPRVM